MTAIVAILKDDAITTRVVFDYIGGIISQIDTFKSKSDACAHIAEFYNGFERDDIILTELDDSDLDIANIVCHYLGDEQASKFILNRHQINTAELKSAHLNADKLTTQNPNCIDALNLLDDFFVQIGLCSNGELVQSWKREQNRYKQETSFLYPC